MIIQSSRGVRLACVITTLGCLLAGAVGGVILASLRVTGKPQVFRSVAKVVAGATDKNAAFDEWQTAVEDCRNTAIEVIESSELKRKAGERVQTRHSGLKSCEVSIEARRSKGGGVIQILATGLEPKYTQALLNELLNELIEFRQAIREEADRVALHGMLEKIVKQQKTMDEALKAKVAAESDAKNILAPIDLDRLKGRLKLLSNERDDLSMALKGTPEDAAAKKEQVTLLDEEIRRIGVEVTHAEASLAGIRATVDRYEAAKAGYEKLFTGNEGSGVYHIPTDYVAILERASTATEHIEDWKLPVILGGAYGSGLGLVAGLAISAVIVVMGRSEASKPEGS